MTVSQLYINGAAKQGGTSKHFQCAQSETLGQVILLEGPQVFFIEKLGPAKIQISGHRGRPKDLSR